MGYSSSILLIVSMAIVSFGVEVNFIHEWKYADFEWESQEQKQAAINSGTYNPLMCVFEDASKADGRLIVDNLKKFIILNFRVQPKFWFRIRFC